MTFTYPAQWHRRLSISPSFGRCQAEVSKSAQSWAAKQKHSYFTSMLLQPHASHTRWCCFVAHFSDTTLGGLFILWHGEPAVEPAEASVTPTKQAETRTCSLSFELFLHNLKQSQNSLDVADRVETNLALLFPAEPWGWIPVSCT